jgi:hypothetical protein
MFVRIYYIYYYFNASFYVIVQYSVNEMELNLHRYDKVIKTTELSSLFCTVFAIWKNLEAHCFRYFALFSLFGRIWKLIVLFAILHCFRYFALFLLQYLEALGSSLVSKTVTYFLDSSKTVQTVPWCHSLCHIPDRCHSLCHI